MRKMLFGLAAGFTLVVSAAHAQMALPAQMPGEGGQAPMQTMPMTPQGEAGAMQGCPMMQRMASLDERVRQLEEQLNATGTEPTPRDMQPNP